LTNQKKIYFASDFHLGAPNYEKSLEREKKIIRWLDQVKADASEIYLLGDVFDFWFEYRHTIPKGFVRLQGKIDYKDASTNATEKDVIVNTIFCGNYNTGIQGKWQDGAKLTGGDYLTIDQNKEIVHISTPYDDIIIKLNSKLNKTYVRYGKQGSSKYALQSSQDSNAENLEEVVLVKRAVSKSSKMYKNKSWDLVDAEKESNFDYSKVDKKTLPEELKNKSTAELESYVKKQGVEREKIQKEIQELNKKRTKYVTEKKKETSSEETLDSAMMKAIKNQAKKKNYTWE
jgi:hypothetical protein